MNRQLEYAAFMPQGLSTDGSLHILRRPPAIDANRVAMGWQSSKPVARATATKPKPKAITKKSAPASQTIATLTLACAPGLSRPVALVGATEELPEFITPRAWRGVLSQIARGQHFPIQMGHKPGSKIITSTASPRVRTKLCPTAGLCLFVDVRANDPYIIRTAGCSISFRPTSYHTENVGGQRVRCIDGLLLEHVAIIEALATELPVYPMARIRRCTPKLAATGMTELVVDVGCLIRASWPELRPLIRG
jgi:hypothetical protein